MPTVFYIAARDYSIPYIIEILGVCRLRYSSWIKAWDNIGLLGLIERQRSFCPRKLSLDEEKEVILKVKENPRGIKRIIPEITNKMGVSICKDTLRRICKRAGLRWKRIKKRLHKEKDEKAYQETVELIIKLFSIRKTRRN